MCLLFLFFKIINKLIQMNCVAPGGIIRRRNIVKVQTHHPGT